MLKNQQEGLLFVTISHAATLEEKKGTVCGSEGSFNINSSRVLCEAMGFPVRIGVWGSHPEFKYVSRFLVLLILYVPLTYYP